MQPTREDTRARLKGKPFGDNDGDDERYRSLFAAAAEGCNPADMETLLTAQDLWPLLLKLPHDEQLRLAKLALHAASGGGREDARVYRAAPPAEEEFPIADNPLAWEGEGWDEY